MALESNVPLLTHDHSATGSRATAKLLQANTHQSPDTDTATTALHHTLGTGVNQAAAGNLAILNTQRAPIGALTTQTSSSSVTPDATAGVAFRYTATGALTINAPTGGVDTERMLIEILASGGAQTITFVSAFEISQAVPGRVFTIPNATYGYFALVCRAGTWRLVSAEPQTAIVVPTLPLTSLWMPADQGWLAWTGDPMYVAQAQSIPSGNLYGTALRIDTSVTVSNIINYVNVAGATFTANTSYAGIYNSAGTLIASTADMATTWNSTGAHVMPVITPVVCPAGVYFIGVISQVATTVVNMIAVPVYGQMMNLGRTSTSWRAAQTTTTYSALPATRPAASNAISPIWFALS